ncbi:hypothetical protein BTUL_0019g00370 [Botrytis tulipae]|uniref:Aminoglycoside phosphotransferase domain-containing protein n=1 Tax=Botrytis tulipae TaxID=87230 RepID=A0A4Z1F7R2_9HELO|nr:hypothetical protein BTUL_0019g00370 [Botrytis tulipae]
MESIDTARKEDHFSRYQWNLFSLQDGALRSRTQTFLASVNWPGLLEYAATKRLGESTYDEATVKRQMSCELNAISLVRQQLSIPTPEVHTFGMSNDSIARAPFILMDCSEGNVGMDLGLKIPREYMQTFFARDGKNTRGPFDTATAFYTAWVSSVEFRKSEDKLRAASGPYAAEIIPRVVSFPAAVSKIASKPSVRDNGPFPLCHGDFGHNNIIVDDKYRIVGLIDWEMAFAGPWEIFGDFPLTLSVTTPAIDAPFNCGRNGLPKVPELIQKFTDQAEYIVVEKQVESQSNHDHKYSLSESLSNTKRQHIATALRLYSYGKVGVYAKLIDKFA